MKNKRNKIDAKIKQTNAPRNQYSYQMKTNL